MAGLRNGAASQAQFDNPTALAIDADGNIYVAEQGNNCIRKISNTGIVGPAFGTDGRSFTDQNGVFRGVIAPVGIATDNNNVVYFTSRDVGSPCACTNMIFKITQGVPALVAGSGPRGFTDGPALTARFNNPAGIAVDASGTIYVAELLTHRVRRITTDQVVSTLAGSATDPSMGGFLDGPAAISKFNFPWGVSVDDSGYVYVADFFNSRIRKIY